MEPLDRLGLDPQTPTLPKQNESDVLKTSQTKIGTKSFAQVTLDKVPKGNLKVKKTVFLEGLSSLAIADQTQTKPFFSKRLLSRH